MRVVARRAAAFHGSSPKEKSRLLKELKDVSSDLLQNLLAALPADRRSELVAAMDVMSQDLVETPEEP